MRSEVSPRFSQKEKVVQIDSKMTTCCLIMQPMGNLLVLSILAAQANWGERYAVVLIRNLCKLILCNFNLQFFRQLFIFLTDQRYYHQFFFKRLELINYVSFFNRFGVTYNAIVKVYMRVSTVERIERKNWELRQYPWIKNRAKKH